MPAANDPVEGLVALIGDTFDNHANLRRLILQLRTQVGVTPFVGAGLSRPFGYPKWAEFLLAQAHLAGLVPEIEEKMRVQDYEGAAQTLLEARGNRAFNDAISDIYDVVRLAGEPITGAVALLPRFNSGPVVTTNFDRVIEEAFSQAGAEFHNVVWGGNADSATQALQEGKRVLLKIHGDAQERHDRVLTRDDYDRQYGPLPNTPEYIWRPVPRLLLQMLMGRPLLFLGCSLGADRTMRVLLFVAENNPSLVHYAIVPRPEGEDELRHRDRFLSERNIRPIWYTAGRHDLIEPLLDGLLNAAITPSEGLSRVQSAQAVLRALASREQGLLTSLNERQVTISVHESHIGLAHLQVQAAGGDVPGGFHTEEGIPAATARLHNDLPLGLVQPHVAQDTQVNQLVVRIKVETADGETLSLPFVHLRALRHDEQQVLLENIDQPMPIRVRLALDNVQHTGTINFNFAGPPVNVSQVLEWYRLRRCLSKDVTVRVFAVDSGLLLIEEHWEEGTNEAPPEGWIREFEDLQRIQAKVRVAITVPTEDWSEEDRFAINRLRTILHQGRVTGRWADATLNGPAASVRVLLEHLQQEGRKLLVITQDDTEQLFGLALPLGEVQVTYNDVRLADEEGVRRQLAEITDDETNVQVRIVPGEDDTLLWEYVDWLPNGAQTGEETEIRG